MSMQSNANYHLHKLMQDKISGDETCNHDFGVYNQPYLRTLLAAVEAAITDRRRSGCNPQLQEYLALTGIQTDIYTRLLMDDK